MPRAVSIRHLWFRVGAQQCPNCCVHRFGGVSGVKRCQTLALVVVIYGVHEGKACWLVKLTI